MLVGSGEISQELGRHETMLWSGEPGRGVRMHDSDLLLAAFGLFFLSAPVLMAVTMLRDGAAWFTPLFLVPHSLIGLHMAIGRFFVDAKVRAHTRYFVTDRRALILRTWPRRRVDSVWLSQLDTMSRFAHRDGTMTIVLGKPPRRRVPAPAFEWISGGQGVYQLILEAREDDDEDGDDEGEEDDE